MVYTNVSYTDRCPDLLTSQTIRIDYKQIVVDGSSEKHYEKAGFFCQFSRDCHSLDPYGMCPLLENAPDVPTPNTRLKS